MIKASIATALSRLLLLPEQRDASLLQWRISILRSLQLATLVLGPLTMLQQAFFPVPEQALIFFVDGLALAALAALTFYEGIPHHVRAWLSLAVGYLFWMWLFPLIDIASLPNLLALPMFAVLLLGLRAGFIMLAICCIGLFVMGMAFAPYYVIGDANELTPLQTWSLMLGVYAFTASLITVACGVLINRLEYALTLSRQAQEESFTLSEHMREMEKLQAIGTLASGVAHDFNNVLAIIMALAESIKDKEKDSQISEQLDQILLSSERGRDIVRQLLMFSRHSISERSTIDAFQVLNQMEPLLRAQMPAGAALSFSIIPPDYPMTLVASAAEIQQIMMNLVGNAVLALRSDVPGQVSIQVRALAADDDMLKSYPSLDTHDNYVSVEVRDNGVGIPADVVSRLFEPFFTTRGVGEGTGLGLASCHGIINSLGGSITVESNPGVGSCFRFVLPVSNSPTPASPPSELPREAPTASVLAEQTPILMVDDEPLILATGRFLLENAGYPVTAVNCAAQAREILAQQDFALMITDYSMPGENGVSLIRHARELKPGMSIILVTGRGQIDELDVDVAEGIVIMAKPYKKQDLLNAISQLV